MYDVGTIHTNKQGKEAIVIERLEYRKRKIKFLESGYTMIVNAQGLYAGHFKDYGSPTLLGIGYTFKGCTSYIREYKTWTAMMDRCYNPDHKQYKLYGGRGVVVDDRWLFFKNFLEDLPSLKNYDKWLLDTSYTLDKDIKGSGKKYSKLDCVFASKKEQASPFYVPVVSVDSEGKEIIHESITEASKELGLHRPSIQQVLSGEMNTTGGYTFYRL